MLPRDKDTGRGNDDRFIDTDEKDRGTITGRRSGNVGDRGKTSAGGGNRAQAAVHAGNRHSTTNGKSRKRK